jgi:hypothetical protein
MHKIMSKKFYLGPKFGTLFDKKWITISELLHQPSLKMLEGMFYLVMNVKELVIFLDAMKCI